jgi:glutamine amidotransferase
MDKRIAIIDYGAGNTHSVEKALTHAGAHAAITANLADIETADGVVLPGVGAAADTMSNLQSRGLIEPILAYIATGRPFLGVCMGLQALLDWSEEGGGVDCLGIVPGEVRLFPTDTGAKVPHMGWNTVEWVHEMHPISQGIPNHSYFYFVHSYFPAVDDQSYALGMTEYAGITFPSVITHENVVATQFHPEKSGTLGLKIYSNFVEWVKASSLNGTVKRPAPANA